jgi:23S rRNA (guanosine2251-2'-O)-methyltransferase
MSPGRRPEGGRGKGGGGRGRPARAKKNAAPRGGRPAKKTPGGRGPAFAPRAKPRGEDARGRDPRGRGEHAHAPDGVAAADHDGPPPSRYLYGRNPVREALRARRRRISKLWLTEAAAHEAWDFASPTITTAEEIEALCGTDAHQGVCALAGPYPYADAEALLAVPDFLLVALDEVTDPQNLGAVARTAEAVGATGLIIPERRSAEVTPAAAKASAGAVEHLPIAQVRNLADFLADAKEHHEAWVYGAAAGARTAYDKPDYSGNVVLVLGAEGKGLRPRVASMCDDLVALPLRGRIESLNVSATAAVLLYRILQSRVDAST